MPKKNIHQEEIVIAKKQLSQLASLKDKVSCLNQQWKGQIGVNIPEYSKIVSHLEVVEKQIFSQIGHWKKSHIA